MRLISLICLLCIVGCESSRVDKHRNVTFEEAQKAFQERDEALTGMMGRIIEIEKKMGISKDEKEVK